MKQATQSTIFQGQRGKPLRQPSFAKPRCDKMTADPNKPVKIALYDRYLVFATLAVLLVGLMMVYSASIVISEKMYGNPFHFVMRQASFLAAGLFLSIFVIRVSIQSWQTWGFKLFWLSLFFLIVVLVPGVGRSVNGSVRWLGFAGLGFQVSEFAKLSVIIYMARYMVQHQQAVQNSFIGFIKPMIMLAFMALLLLKEPDFGSTTVILSTALALLFLGGAQLWQFMVLFSSVVGALIILAISSPYRMARLTSFLNPWQNPFDSGYQLTQSLIAFGRGGLFGVGLGDSVQKLFYLPEAHTDFLFAVLSEELGVIWAGLIIILFSLIVYRALKIGLEADSIHQKFAAYVAYGLGLWVAMQVFINIGVNSGLLPTKGLTLPLMSYGGSSMMIMCVAFSLLFRIDYENRLARYGLHKKSARQHLHHAKRPSAQESI